MDLEKKAIQRIKTASELSFAHYGLPLVLADSGGKDSAVCRTLLIRSGVPFEVSHNLTTADAPQTIYYVRDIFRELETKGIACAVNRPVYRGEPTTMWKLIPQKKIPPTRLARYCCEVLKEGGGAGRFIVTGVRWAESKKREDGRGIYERNARSKSSRIILNSDNDDRRKLFESCRVYSKHMCNPIIDWSDRVVWEYIRGEKIRLNPLYEMGFMRVGCIGCPMAGKGRYKEFALFPKYKQAYIRAFERMLEARRLTGRTDTIGSWKSGEAVFRWWMQDANIEGQMEMMIHEDSNQIYY